MLCAPSQFSKTILSLKSLGKTEKSSIVPLPPKISIPVLITSVALIAVPNLLALIRKRYKYLLGLSSFECKSYVRYKVEAKAAYSSALIFKRSFLTIGKFIISCPNALRVSA